jgi:2-oxoglutarate dehydrogenase E2 component (dihydrolipoamide succinyltransferase)
MPNIVVPTLGESVVEARVAKWLKQEGQAVSAGEPLVELETEKVDLEVSAEVSGVLSSITRREGEDVKIGEVLGVVTEGATAGAPGAVPAPAPSPEQAKAAPPALGAGPASAATPSAPTAPLPAAERSLGAEETRATPTARRVAEKNAVDLGAVAGSGAQGRVLKQDVEAAIGGTGKAAASAPPSMPPVPAAAPPAPAAARKPADPRGEKRVRMTKRRATIARRLVEAQHTAAMLTTFNEVDMSAVMALRERHKDAFKAAHGVGLGIASFFVKAAIGALRAFPQLNAEIQGDEIVYKPFYDVGIAVGAEGGLVVPVLRDADRLSFSGIELAIREYAKKAQDGTLTFEDLLGGTFTITNGGVFGSMLSTPILNPPQVGILGLHKIQDRPVAVKGQVVVRPVMYIALSYDHRIVDGREAVQFLVKVKDFIEDPGQLLLEA